MFAAGLFVFFVDMLVGNPRDVTENLLSRHGPILLAVLALAPIFLHDLCKLTNRFAGPIVRLRRALHDSADGRDVSPIHFRKHDFWRDLAGDFNRVAERIQSTNKTTEEEQFPTKSTDSDAV